MRKEILVTSILLSLLLILVILLAGCAQKQEPLGVAGNLFNQSLNEQIENLTKTTPEPEPFKEFYFNYTPRPGAKYEIARDNIFNITKGNFTSTQVSFFGVMLGDSYEQVIARLGNPNTEFTAEDKSYINMDYTQRIGLADQEAGLTFHIENNTVTSIIVRLPFNKYLHGNTTLGQPKEEIYALLDVPDYQSFALNFRIFHYVEKGLELYLKADKADRMLFMFPKEFKGVKYITVTHVGEKGIVINTTEPVLIE